MLLSLLKDLMGSRKDERILQEAREHIAASRNHEAISALTALLERRPDSVEALLMRGVAARGADLGDQSLADLTRAVELEPSSAPCLYELAHTIYAIGDHRRAHDLCARARVVDPEFAPARWLQAQIILGGQHYFKVLERILAELRPRTYVEIGVFQGDSLALVKPPARAIGIDPDPKLIAPLAENHKVFADTSDDFFARHDLRLELGDRPVDLAFIDGMHHFEFALRDFANLERYCTRQSTILIHDCYPLDRETAVRDDGPPSFWSGDIWRLIVLLKKYRSDLEVHVVGAPPTGLAVVRNLDPDSRFLIENYEKLHDEFIQLDFSYLDHDKAGKLSLVKNEWENVRRLLTSS